MRVTQRDFAVAAPRAAQQARISFFCGPDEAGAAAAADKLAAMLPDSGERIDLSGADLRVDPVRLGDEARSTSLFGDTRHIMVRANGDEAYDAVATLLGLIDTGEGGGACPVLILATSATDKSRTAKLLEKRDDALVAMFYPPDLRAVSEDVARMGAAAGLRLGGGLAERIARAAGLDVRLAQSEVTKLALYLDASQHDPKPVTEEALDAIGAKTEEDGFMPLVNAVLSGEVSRLSGELRRLREVSLNPVGVLLALERRAAQLAQLIGRMSAGNRVNDVLDAEQKAHRVFWRDKKDLTVQLQRWNGPKIERLIPRLTALHRSLLANSQAAELLLTQELADIARYAQVRVDPRKRR